jgi:hypothetical protein
MVDCSILCCLGGTYSCPFQGKYVARSTATEGEEREESGEEVRERERDRRERQMEREEGKEGVWDEVRGEEEAR